LETLCYRVTKALLEMENMPTAVRVCCNCQFAIPGSLKVRKGLRLGTQADAISIDDCAVWIGG